MMTDTIQQALTTLSYSFIPVLLGITLHEVAHGYVAYMKGDPTARSLGRLTLNPIAHIDPMGLLVFVATAIMTPFVFGWAKPVPVNPRYFRKPRYDMMWVAAAGPATNFVLAILFAVILKGLFVFFPPQEFAGNTVFMFLVNMCKVGVFANFGLAWINLLPIPPLDGSRLVMGILPRDLAIMYSSMERFGFLILLVLIYFNLLTIVLLPLIKTSVFYTFKLVGL